MNNILQRNQRKPHRRLKDTLKIIGRESGWTKKNSANSYEFLRMVQTESQHIPTGENLYFKIVKKSINPYKKLTPILNHLNNIGIESFNESISKPRKDLIIPAEYIIKEIFSFSDILPFNVNPLPEGGIIIEFRINEKNRRISIELNNDGHHSVVILKDKKEFEISEDLTEHEIYKFIKYDLKKYLI